MELYIYEMMAYLHSGYTIYIEGIGVYIENNEYSYFNSGWLVADKFLNIITNNINPTDEQFFDMMMKYGKLY